MLVHHSILQMDVVQAEDYNRLLAVSSHWDGTTAGFNFVSPPTVVDESGEAEPYTTYEVRPRECDADEPLTVEAQPRLE